jgi:phosphate uptake regulator
MAQEETIKIIIEANAEQFKQTAAIINSELGKLGNNFQILQKDINSTAGSMDRFDKSGKKFNKGIMSISLILQDLPYGFRGIQNNIPALVGSFGLVYLAISAVTAAMTYFVLQGDKMSKGTKDLFDTFKNFVNGVASDLYNTLYPAFKSITESVQYLWAMFGENIINQFKIIWDNLLAFLKLGGAILANAFTVVTSLIKGDWTKFGESLLNIFKLAWNGIIQFLSFALKTVSNGIGGFVKIFDKDLGVAIVNAAELTANDFSKKFKYAFKEVETAAKKIDVFSLFNFGKKDNKGKADKSLLDKLTAQYNFYKDNVFMAGYYGKLMLDEERNVALKEAKINKASKEDIKNINEEYAFKELTLFKQIEAQKFAIREQSIKRQEQLTNSSIKTVENAKKEEDRISKEFIDAYNSDINQQESDFNQFYKTKMDLATGDLEAQKEILLQQRAQLEEGLVLQGISWSTYTKGVGANVKAVAQISAKITKEAFDSLMQMGNAIMNALGPSLDMLLEKGASIGDVLTSAFHSIIRQLAKVIISAGIAVALLAILFPGMLAKAGGAGAVFKGLIGQGMGIGGLIGGGGTSKGVDATNGTNAINTIQSNSSAGQGGGNFVLKGQDLVLALNRSESSLKLRRG